MKPNIAIIRAGENLFVKIPLEPGRASFFAVPEGDSYLEMKYDQIVFAHYDNGGSYVVNSFTIKLGEESLVDGQNLYEQDPETLREIVDGIYKNEFADVA